MLDFIMTAADYLAAHWNAFCDDAAVPAAFKSWDEFIDRMTDAGLARLRVADVEGVPTIDCPMVWCLTAEGQAAFDEAHARNGS